MINVRTALILGALLLLIVAIVIALIRRSKTAGYILIGLGQIVLMIWLDLRITFTLETPGVLLLILIIGAIVIALFRRSKALKYILIGFGVILLLVGLRALNSTHGLHQSVGDAPSDFSISDEITNSALSDIWGEGFEKSHLADVYPSKAYAAKALGWHIADKLSGNKVNLFNENADKSLLFSMTEGISEIDGSIIVKVANKVIELSGQDVLVDIDCSSPGEIRLTVSGVKNFLVKTRYQDKDWLIAPDAHVRNGYFVARSYGTSLSPTEAASQAKRQVLGYVSKKLKPQRNLKHIENISNYFTYEDLIDVSKLGEYGNSLINIDDIIDDSLSQCFSSASGRIYRDAILVKLSQNNLTCLSRLIGSRASSEQQSFLQRLGAFAGMMLLISGVYVFLNYATKGYYTLSLRILGFGTIIALMIFLIMLG